jgi:hypothetical protein
MKAGCHKKPAELPRRVSLSGLWLSRQTQALAGRPEVHITTMEANYGCATKFSMIRHEFLITGLLRDGTARGRAWARVRALSTSAFALFRGRRPDRHGRTRDFAGGRRRVWAQQMGNRLRAENTPLSRSVGRGGWGVAISSRGPTLDGRRG